MTTVTKKQYEQALRIKVRTELQIEELERQMLHDPEIIEAVRLRSWVNHDKSRISGTMFDPVAPEGWPPGVDSSEEIEVVVLGRLRR